eukprot:jgi/Botrbrau1/3193/Bobra.37_2s0023.1
MSKHRSIPFVAILCTGILRCFAQGLDGDAAAVIAQDSDSDAAAIVVAGAASPPPPPPAIPAGLCGPAGFYHISCYTANIAPEGTAAAKAECLSVWNKPSGCSAVVWKFGQNIVNCPSAVIYYFLPTQDCRAAYQAQEKTNPSCVLYDSLGLGNSSNRVSFSGSSDYTCSGIPPPPSRSPPLPAPPPPPPAAPAGFCGPFGYYHLSCYTANIASASAAAAKTQCIAAWAKPAGCKGAVFTHGRNIGNCPTAVIYYFQPTADCRASYQGQEKTNAACLLYNSLGLGNSTNRVTFNGSSDFTCSGLPPPPPPPAGPPPPSPRPPPPPPVPAGLCGPFGHYHISCYTANIDPTAAAAAKTQCISAWPKPVGCSGVVFRSGRNIVNCPTAVIYYFLPSTDCRANYQAQEKTNAACTMYNSLGLGNTTNRVAFNGSSDYTCTGISPSPPPAKSPSPPPKRSPPPPSPKSPPPRPPPPAKSPPPRPPPPAKSPPPRPPPAKSPPPPPRRTPLEEEVPAP